MFLKEVKFFFDELAKEKKFHPTKNYEEWSKVFHYEIKERKVLWCVNTCVIICKALGGGGCFFFFFDVFYHREE